jgi:hypothetical protein
MNPVTIRVPSPFAKALRDDLLEPADDDERESITDPEQLVYEAKIDAGLEQWLTALDGEGDRTLDVDDGPAGEWFADYMGSAMLEGLTWQLHDGSTTDRQATVVALVGWVDVMEQLDEARRG